MLLFTLAPQVISDQTKSGTLENNPPYVPTYPIPPDGATEVPIDTILSWHGGDPDGDPVTYDVYFDTINPPAQVAFNISETTYNPETFLYETQYFWKIVAWDNSSASTESPIWNFTTENQPNQPPYPPSDPKPANETTNVDVNADLKWTATDPEGDTLTFDIYFGITNPPQQVASGHTATAYDPGKMEYITTYYWQIISSDGQSGSTEGAIWHFTTGEETNGAPNRPVISGAIGLIFLPDRDYEYNFTSIDPDHDDVFYYIDWGDGTYENWFGPYAEGLTVAVNHSWPPVTKLYEIKAKSKDIYGAESDWASFQVFVIKGKTSTYSVIVRVLQRFPILERILTNLPIFNRVVYLK